MTTKYTKDHEWVRIEGNIATCGITAYAAEQLGDVVFVELPKIGRIVSQGDEIAVVESVKAASDVYAPVSGEIVDANEALVEAPEGVNEAAETTGWFTKLKLTDPGEVDAMMDRAAYDAYLAGL
jgi:glycine cleavage system H protein